MKKGSAAQTGAGRKSRRLTKMEMALLDEADGTRAEAEETKFEDTVRVEDLNVLEEAVEHVPIDVAPKLRWQRIAQIVNKALGEDRSRSYFEWKAVFHLKQQRTWNKLTENGDFGVEVDMRECDLVGQLPDLRRCVNLRRLYLDDNVLEGHIPDLSACCALEVLQLKHNQFTGPIPSLRKLIHLERFNIARNKCTGSIPDLSRCTKLKYFSVAGNNLSGSVPQLLSCKALVSVQLQGNDLTGPIPQLPRKVALFDISGTQCAGAKEWKADRTNYPNFCCVRVPSSAEPNPFWQCEVRIEKEAQRQVMLKRQAKEKELHDMSLRAEAKRHEAMRQFEAREAKAAEERALAEAKAAELGA